MPALRSTWQDFVLHFEYAWKIQSLINLWIGCYRNLIAMGFLLLSFYRYRMANHHYVLITILTLTCLDMELVFAIKQYFKLIHAFNVHPLRQPASEQHTLQHGSNWIIICRFIARCPINITTSRTKNKICFQSRCTVCTTFVWHFRAHHTGTNSG